jgi:hypothetical protein
MRDCAIDYMLSLEGNRIKKTTNPTESNRTMAMTKTQHFRFSGLRQVSDDAQILQRSGSTDKHGYNDQNNDGPWYVSYL